VIVFAGEEKWIQADPVEEKVIIQDGRTGGKRMAWNAGDGVPLEFVELKL
jgi:hypothetical protein